MIYIYIIEKWQDIFEKLYAYNNNINRDLKPVSKSILNTCENR